MAEVLPFTGIGYDEDAVGNVSHVICPPYDVINTQLHEELYRRSEYNFVRVEYGREYPQDNAQDNRYSRSKITIEDWLQKGVLKSTAKPAIYLHDHYFGCQKKRYKRRNLIAAVRLVDWEEGIVLPHEGTLAKPKADRINVLRTLQANTSPILAMYDDPRNDLASFLRLTAITRPKYTMSTYQGESHQLWEITEPDVLERIARFFADLPLYIADGHHRYESALFYQRECARSATHNGNEPYNFVMMSLVNFSQRGLLVLPPHRLLRGIAPAALNTLKENIHSFFDVSYISLNNDEAWGKLDEVLRDRTVPQLAMYGLERDKLMVLKVRDMETINKLMPYFHSDIYKKLDVSIIDHIILENLLGINNAHEDAELEYCYDRNEAVSRVQEGEYQLSFLLNDINSAAIKAISDVGDRMPRKSTYFYPKTPAGLIFRRLV